MKNKATRFFVMLLAVVLCMGTFSMTAFAANDEDSDGAEAGTLAQSGSSDALTPDGNLTLVDDTESGDKEFITVQTKDGNTFYLIIDHASDEDNVYFLNLVDEEDLLALIKDEDFVSEYQANKDNTADYSSEAETSSTAEPAAQTSAEPEAQQETTDGNSGPIAAALFATVIIGVAVWFFKFRKPGKLSKGKPDPDEADDAEFEDDTSEAEEEPEAPDEETESEDE